MLITIVTTREVEVNVERLKKIGNFEVEDILEYGECTYYNSNISAIHKGGSSGSDETVNKRIMELIRTKSL